jgi:hypothetical protein
MTRPSTHLAIVLGCSAFAAAGCHGSLASDETSAESQRRIEVRGTAPPRLPERVPEAASPVTGEAPADLVARVRDDLVRRSGKTEPDLRLVRDQAVTWNDGSLGCPRPGEVYPQVLVPGYWIVFVVGDREFDYRADERGHFRLCEPRLSSPPAPRNSTE